MPRTRRNKEKALEAKISELVRRREFVIGLVTLFVLGAALTGVVLKKTTRNTMVASNENMVSPVPTEQAASTSATMTYETAKNEKSHGNTGLSQIKVLADTAGAVTVVAKTGDNFWRLSKQVCGTGEYAQALRVRNGYEYKALQPGDSVSVECAY